MTRGWVVRGPLRKRWHSPADFRLQLPRAGSHPNVFSVDLADPFELRELRGLVAHSRPNFKEDRQFWQK